MPGVQVQEGHQEVEADGCGGGDDQVGEDIVAECFLGFGVFQLDHDDVDGGECGVGHDDAVCDHTAQEHLLGALWTVSH